MKVCVWGGWYGSRNVGDQALLISIAQELRARDPGVEIVVLSKNTDHIRTYMAREGLDVLPLSKVKDFFRMIHALRTSDLFLFGGGVPFYDQWVHVAIMLFLVGVARLFKTPVMTLGVATQYLRGRISRPVYRYCLSRFEHVTVRDAHTHTEFQNLGVKREMSIVGDVALLMQPAPPERIDRLLAREGIPADVPPIFIVPRRITAVQPFARAHYRHIDRAMAERIRLRLARAADQLTEFGQVVFLPFHTSAPDDDRRMADDVIARMKHGDRVLKVERQYSPPEALGILQRGELLLGSRLHSIILSASAGCPCVMAAFDLKHFGIADLLGLDGNVLDLTQDEGPTPEEIVERAWHGRSAARAHLHARVAMLRGDIRVALDSAMSMMTGRELRTRRTDGADP